jgi:hypothetical protein
VVCATDFGYRNPFAAVWGLLDRDDVLWLVGEHYQREQLLSYHAEHLPKGFFWYADPASPGEIDELIGANFTVTKGRNEIRPGIMAVNARVKDGRLKIIKDACPHLLREAALYRYSDDPLDRRAENPVDAHNHALAALRYLIASIDHGKLARPRPRPPEPPHGSQPPNAA